MNWLNLETRTLHSPEFIGSKPIARATWLNVALWSAQQENGGRILGARDWADRQWQQTCGVTLKEVAGAAPLLEWEGRDLIVWSYPLEQQAQYQKVREGGKRGGEKKTEAKTQAARENGAKGGRPKTQAITEPQTEAVPETEPKGNPSHNPTKGNGKEGKVMERNGKEMESSESSEIRPVPTPTLDEVIAFGSGPNASVPATVCEAWWLDHEARPRDITGGYTDKSGLLIADWRSSLRAFGLRWRNNDEQRNHGRAPRPAPTATKVDFTEGF